MTYVFNVEDLDFTGIKQEWEAENLGLRTFKKQNPDPKPPAKPAPAERGEAMVVKHNNGGLWLELAQQNQRFNHPQLPAVELMLVVDKEATVVTLTCAQVTVLKSEIERVFREITEAQFDFDVWRAEQAGFEDAQHAWQEAAEAAGKAAEAAWHGRREKGKVKSQSKAKENEDGAG